VDVTLGHVAGSRIPLAVAGVAGPIVVMLLAARLAPVLSAALLRLEADPESSRGSDGPTTAPTRGSGFVAAVSRIICRRPAERAAFELIWNIAGRDRQFKLRTYPMVIFGMIGAAGMIFGIRRPPSDVAGGVDPSAANQLLFLYMSVMMLPAALMQVRFSERFEAAWLYRVLPFELPGDVLIATLKMIALRLVLPSFALVAAISIALFGLRSLPDVAVAGVVMLLMCAIQALVLNRSMPFSEGQNAARSSGAITLVMLITFLPVIFGFIHFAMREMPIALAVYAALQLLLAAVLLRSYRRLSWRSMGWDAAA